MTRRWLTVALLCAGPLLAASDPPYPYPDRPITVGAFLRLVCRALDLNVVVRDAVPRDKPVGIPLQNLSCREALELVLAAEDLTLVEFRPGLYVVDRAGPRAPPSVTPAERAPSVRHPVVLPVSFLSRDELTTALRAVDGPPPEEIAWLPGGRGVAVNGTPEQVERLRALLGELDRAPESVTVGVASASAVRERFPRTAASGQGVLWVATFSGAPARIAVGQVFQGLVTTEVGLSLEVVPRVQGRAVHLTVALVDASPTRVTDVGVDRSQRVIVTEATVPRGGAVTVGGLGRALTSFRPTQGRRDDLSLTLFVK